MATIRQRLVRIADLGLKAEVLEDLLKIGELFEPLKGFKEMKQCTDSKSEKNLWELSAKNCSKVARIKGLAKKEQCDTKYVLMVAMLVKGLEIPSLRESASKSSTSLDFNNSATRVADRVPEFKTFFELTDEESKMLHELIEKARDIHRVLANKERYKKNCFPSKYYKLLILIQHFDVENGWFDESRYYGRCTSFYQNAEIKEARKVFLASTVKKNLWKEILPWIHEVLTELDPQKSHWGTVTRLGRKKYQEDEFATKGGKPIIPEKEDVQDWVRGLLPKEES